MFWRDDGAVKLSDAALRYIDLMPAERILELDLPCAARLASAGQLIPLKSDEWTEKVRSPEHVKIQKKE